MNELESLRSSCSNDVSVTDAVDVTYDFSCSIDKRVNTHGSDSVACMVGNMTA